MALLIYVSSRYQSPSLCFLPHLFSTTTTYRRPCWYGGGPATIEAILCHRWRFTVYPSNFERIHQESSVFVTVLKRSNHTKIKKEMGKTQKKQCCHTNPMLWNIHEVSGPWTAWSRISFRPLLFWGRSSFEDLSFLLNLIIHQSGQGWMATIW